MKRKVTLEKHKELGAELYSLRNKLLSYSEIFASTYGKTVDISKFAKAAIQNIDKLRWKMEGRLSQEHPQDFDVHIYFPGSQGKDRQ
jgi:hypothetical protein